MNENCFWSQFTPEIYYYCERQLCGFVQQPANTWSNIGYLIVAILILRFKHPRTEKLFMFWAMFLLFVGSTLFHMTGTSIGKLLDVGAMLILSMGILSISAKRYFRWERKKTLIVFFSGLFLSFLYLYFVRNVHLPFALEVITAAILEYRMIREGRGVLDLKLLGLCLVSEGLAGIGLVLDVTKTWCEPDNHLINGHAVWHLFSATTVYIFMRARKSE